MSHVKELFYENMDEGFNSQSGSEHTQNMEEEKMTPLITDEQIAEHFGIEIAEAVNLIMDFSDEFPQFVFPIGDELHVDDGEFFKWYIDSTVGQSENSTVDLKCMDDPTSFDDDYEWRPRLIYGLEEPYENDCMPPENIDAHLDIKRVAERFCGNHGYAWELIFLFDQEFPGSLLVHGDDYIVEEKPFVQWMNESACGQYPICKNCVSLLGKIA